MLFAAIMKKFFRPAPSPPIQKKVVVTEPKHQLNATLNTDAFFNGRIMNQIGNSSANGAVFAMKMKNGTRKVIKIIKSPLGKQEFNFQKKAGQNGISPKVYKLKQGVVIPREVYMNFFPRMKGDQKFDAFLMNDLKLHDTDKIESLYNYFKRASPNERNRVFKKLKFLVIKLHKLGIEHGDLHGGNAYVIIHEDGKIDVKIIDFGRSRKRPTINTRSMTTGKFYGKNVTKEYEWNEPIFQRSSNINPVVPNRVKLQGFKNKFSLS